MSYRQSFLRLVDKCPHSGKLYLDVDGAVPSHPLHRGRAFHLFAEKAGRAMLEHGEVEMAQADGKAILHEVLMENPDLVVPAVEMDLLRQMVFHWCESFRLPSPDAQFEEELSMEVGKATVTGTVDLSWMEGDTCHIRDYKSGWGLMPQDDVSSKDEDGNSRGAKAFQLIVYALLKAQTVKARVFDCRFVFPAFSGLVEREVTIWADDLVEHRLFLTELVNRTIGYELTGEWPAVPGQQCSVCPAPQRCPIPADLRPIDDLNMYEDGPLAYALAAWDLEQQRKRVLKSLKSHVEVFGPVPVGSDQEWSLKAVSSSRTDAKAKAKLEAGEHVPSADLFKASVSTRFGLNKKGAVG